MRRVLSLFRADAPGTARPSKPEPLPEPVLNVLDAASIVVRPSADEEVGDRAIVMLPGSTGFIFSPEAARKVIANAWPELAEEGIKQAVARLGRLVSARHAQSTRDTIARMRSHGGDAPETRPYLHRY